MRLRTDDWWTAGRKRVIDVLKTVPDPRTDTETNWAESFLADLNNPDLEAAQPGDAWRIVWIEPGSWASSVEEDDPRPLAGYILTCPSPECLEGVHLWVQAGNCNCRDKETQKCCHDGKGSCWDWSGKASDGTLTANPSLFASGAKCAWHGWLRNGEMTSA